MFNNIKKESDSMKKYMLLILPILLLTVFTSTYCVFTKSVSKTGSITTVESSATFLDNNDFLTKIQVLDSSITSVDKTSDLNRYTSIPNVTFTSDNLFSTTTSKMPIYVWIENNNIYYYTAADNIDLNNN